MALVFGTSTCHMVVSQSKLFIPRVWGPFCSAMIPQYWLTEDGQSATGALLDYIIENHVYSPRLANRAGSQNVSLFELLNNKLRTIMDDIKAPFLAALTQDVHVLPDFHGNRSPAADPKAKGIICGMTLDTSDSNWLFHTLLPCRVLHMVHAILWRIAMLMVTQDELRIRWLVYVLIQHLDEEKDWELVALLYYHEKVSLCYWVGAVAQKNMLVSVRP
ncbi:FGGY carbohydrate kinase domain-containing protein-like isoform X3 [Ricinus communis]|uniref:FGGY carbohydrate kinase domain-containing protein-like isoform X3 n=1 Tax=Ricinus communis TaxID=3988 RepID=UPI00201A80D4|nr:FGGY carbohydrate kinase domain-containing protein-like isoform X3 [Ricinus communis]